MPNNHPDADTQHTSVEQEPPKPEASSSVRSCLLYTSLTIVPLKTAQGGAGIGAGGGGY